MNRNQSGQAQERRKPDIPDYTLLRFIGSGAYGDVWVARGITGTLRALKIVYRDRFEDDRPFDREVEGIKRFDPISRQDEGLIDLFHVGQNTSEGFFYYVMELADDFDHGPVTAPENYFPKTLDRMLKAQGRLPFQKALELGISLSKALGCLHKNGLVHRDVKTNNVVYVNGMPKLADMGMVSRVIDSHSFVGTEGFIAPEGPGTPQADVFALGKVLYEASMGMDRKAFPALPDKIDEWPEAEQLQELNEVLLKACNGDPKKRHESAADLYADLACLLSGKSIRKIRALERRIAQFKRAALWVTLFGLVAGVVAFEIGRERSRQAEDRARELGAHVARGLQLIESGDLIQALSPLLAATSLDRSRRDQVNRVRLSSVLDQCPKLTHLWWNTNETSDGQFSRDGRLVVVSTRNHGVHVRDSKSGEVLCRPFGPGQLIETVCFNPDSTRVLVASQDGTVSIWDWRTGARKLCITNPMQTMAARFNHKGDLFVAACADGIARVHQSETGELLRELKGHDGPVNYAVFSHNDKLLVTVGRDKQAQVWSISDGEKIGPPLPHANWVMYAAFSPDDESLVTAGAEGSAYVWDWRSTRQLTPKLEHRDGVSSVEFSPDGALILTTSWDMTARLWISSSGKPLGLNPVLPHSGKLLRGAFAPDGHRIITSCFDGTSRVWDLAGMRPSAKVLSGLIAESGNRLLVQTNNQLQTFNLSTDELVSSIRPHAAVIDNDISANGKFVLALCSNETAKTELAIYNADSANLLGTFPGFSNSLSRVRLNENGTMLSSWQNKTVQMQEVREKRQPFSDIVLKSVVSGVTFSHNGRQFIVGAGAELFSFNSETGAQRFALKHATTVQSACFSGDDRFIVTACGDRSFNAYYAQVWDSRTGAPVGHRIDHKDGVLFACFDAQIRHVLTASEDFTGAITALGQGSPAKRLMHNSQVQRGCFNPEGSCVLMVDVKHCARLWDVKTGDPITLPLPHFFQPLRAGFLDRFSIATTDKFGTSHIWRVPWQRETLQDLAATVSILNGQFVDSTTASNSPAATSARLWSMLKARYPEDFNVSSEEVASWHQNELMAAERNRNPQAVAFHRGVLSCLKGE